MREIKFRAWDKKNNKMSNTMSLLDTYAYWRSVMNDDEPIWMQYTGLLDKNGTPIFEGDIVKSMNSLFSVCFDEFYINGEYDEQKTCFGVAMKELDNPVNIIGINTMKQLEIIGNLYENPELLNNTK